jgi:hypothetical protein
MARSAPEGWPGSVGMTVPGGLVSGGFAGSALACLSLSAVSAGTEPVMSRFILSAGSDATTGAVVAPLPSGKLNICDAHDSIDDDDGRGTSAVVRTTAVLSIFGASSPAMSEPPSSNRSAAFNANRQAQAMTAIGIRRRSRI